MLLTPSLASAAPQRIYRTWPNKQIAPRGDGLMQASILAAHNDARRRYGVKPLVWDAGLAADARAYGAVLARTRTFRHATQVGRPRQGENLWTGTGGAYRYEEMIGSMVDERRLFRPGKFPDVSANGNWASVGHYTQIIWPTTTHVGCALVSNDRDDYLVCRYLPGGNVVGTVLR